MSGRTLGELTVELYRSLAGHAPDPGSLDALRTAIHDNGLDTHPRDWLADLFDAVLAGRAVGPVVFPYDDGDVATFWAEASQVVPGWQVDDQGEWVRLTFPVLGMQVHVSREALTPDGHSCCSYVVEQM